MDTPKSSLKPLSACKKEIEIEIPANEVDREFEIALHRFAERAKIKGFRLGKAPLDMVKRMYFADIKESLINSLAPRAVHQELAAHKIVPANSPVISDVVFEEGMPMKLTARFETWPEFSLPDYKRIKVKRKEKTVDAKDVDQSLQSLRERTAQYEPVEGRGVQDEDYIQIDIQGKDLAVNKLMPREKLYVLAGHPENETGLNQAVLGMQCGEEKDFTIDYPKEHARKKLAGKKILYHLKIISIKEKKLPELDDSFAKDVGKFETLKDLKTEIRRQLQEARESAADREITEEIIRIISEKVEVDLPESVVQQETLSKLRQILQSHPHGATKQEGIQKLQDEARKQAEQTIKNHLILTQIAEKENLEVTEQEMTEEFKAMAKANNVPLAQVVDIMNKNGKKEELKQNLLLRKTVDLLKNSAIIE